MQRLRKLRQQQAAGAIAQALFFLALLAAFVLGMASNGPLIAKRGVASPAANELPRGPLVSPVEKSEGGAYVRGVMRELSVQ